MSGQSMSTLDVVLGYYVRVDERAQQTSGNMNGRICKNLAALSVQFVLEVSGLESKDGFVT